MQDDFISTEFAESCQTQLEAATINPLNALVTTFMFGCCGTYVGIIIIINNNIIDVNLRWIQY